MSITLNDVLLFLFTFEWGLLKCFFFSSITYNLGAYCKKLALTWGLIIEDVQACNYCIYFNEHQGRLSNIFDYLGWGVYFKHLFRIIYYKLIIDFQTLFAQNLYFIGPNRFEKLFSNLLNRWYLQNIDTSNTEKVHIYEYYIIPI